MVRNRKTKYFFKDYNPCGTCYSMCAPQNSISCKFCKKSYHRKCRKLLKKDFDEMKKENNFICEKCYNAQLPFSTGDDIDLFSALFGEGLYPCLKCKRDCVDQMACISCSVCQRWVHHVCTDLSDEEFINNYY